MFDNDYEEYFYSEDPQEIENEKKKKSALMSHFPKMLGTVDQTKYVLRSNNKAKENGHQLMQGEVLGEPKLNAPTKSPVNFGNNENAFNFGAEESDNNITASNNAKVNDFSSLNNKKPSTTINNNLNLDSDNVKNKPDSLWYENGHLNVTFRNDVIKTDKFAPYDPNDRSGCKRRCVTMLKHAGCELSGERIDMTINDNKGRAVSPSTDFQKGINAINKALENKQPIILNVDYKDGTASSADKAGDHFIIVTGKTTINGVTYYHFYDPATGSISHGTANTNILYIKDHFLSGTFIKRNGEVNKYKVTSVRLNN